MEIQCNGAVKEVKAGMCLVDFLKSLNLDPDTVVVECDGEVIARKKYESHILVDGEKLELIRFVGGG
ncbi:MAG: sulfur carrier protein ThiS [Desulfobulbaceae bacterium]|uniref:Sulfur carrier protein ThiS n=1 Tax=Candidatus Desulfobia pelagia TaxID=2841692 RepID=A0A8J6TDB8_9BACT|nr:sulfur carrier protein ThiS [Candidatus Desulfobia pelagia]